MATAAAAAGLLRRKEEDEFLFSGPGRGKLRGQMIESKIASLQDMPTKVSNRRSCRWLNDRLLIELVPRLHLHDVKPLFAPPPWGDELPLSAFCMTGVAAEWDFFRSIDMDLQARLMQLHMTRSSSAEQKKSRLDQDEMIALNAWHRVDRQTREAMKRSFLPHLLAIYEDRVRAFIQDTGDNKLDDVLVLDVQDPFQRLLLHGVCEFYNVASLTVSTTVRSDGGNKQWKTTTIKKRSGTGVPSRITLVNFLTMKKNGSL